MLPDVHSSTLYNSLDKKATKCPSRDEWIKTTHTHTHTQQRNITQTLKKNEMLFAATWMDRNFILLSEVSQSEKDKYHMISICIILKNDTGVPAVAQRKQIQLGTMVLRVQSLASLSGLSIQCSTSRY